MKLSETSLDELMQKLDSDSDGTVSLEEFKTMMHELQSNQKEDVQRGSFWGSLGSKFKRNLATSSVTRTLDVAFQMSDIKKIERMDTRNGNNYALANNLELTHLSYAVHLKGLADPLVVTCGKPGHAEAWMEVFRSGMKSLKLQTFFRDDFQRKLRKV